MVRFEGTFEEFNDHFGPKIRIHVAIMTKSEKNTLGNRCQRCGKTFSSLDAAHKHGVDRKTLMRKALEKYSTGGDRYDVDDLDKLFDEIKEQHKPIEDVFMFLCKDCHKEYDEFVKQYTFYSKKSSKPSILSSSNTSSNPGRYEGVSKSTILEMFQELLLTKKPLKACLQELFKKFPDETIASTDLRHIFENLFPNDNSQKVTDYLWNLRQDGFLEQSSRGMYTLADKMNVRQSNLMREASRECEIVSNSWEYKMGWTTMQNRRNIEKLISTMDSKFGSDSYPLAVKSWYYHYCMHNNCQFSGIICHKNRSEIRFRICRDSFDIKDNRIRNTRWFFQEGRERSIDILEENFDLIMQCLKHAYDCTSTMGMKSPRT